MQCVEIGGAIDAEHRRLAVDYELHVGSSALPRRSMGIGWSSCSRRSKAASTELSKGEQNETAPRWRWIQDGCDSSKRSAMCEECESSKGRLLTIASFKSKDSILLLRSG
jgi:hypothetical protein